MFFVLVILSESGIEYINRCNTDGNIFGAVAYKTKKAYSIE